MPEIVIMLVFLRYIVFNMACSFLNFIIILDMLRASPGARLVCGRLLKSDTCAF